jgi:hypothetical protein
MVENLLEDSSLDSEDQSNNYPELSTGKSAMDEAVSIYGSPRIMSKEESEEYKRKKSSEEPPVRILSREESEGYRAKRRAKSESATLGDYIMAVPTAAVDITLGAAEGFASAVGEFTDNQDIARKISAFRTDVNDAMFGDSDESVKNNFLYKVSSGLGSAIPYLALAIATKNSGYLSKGASGVFMLSSAGQQGRDDYLATQGVTTETASDEQIAESNKVGAMVAVPIALSEKLGVGFMLRPFTKGPVKAKDVMSRLSQYATAGLGEGLTEAAQSGILNTVASEIRRYDPEREITHGMMEGFLIGAIVGGGVNMSVDTVARAVEQSDRLQVGIQNGTINPKDVTDEELGAGLIEIAMENGSIPAPAETSQQLNPTEAGGVGDTISKWLTPLSRRLGRAGPEFKRAFRNYERRTGKKISDLKKEALPFQQEMEALRKSHPEEYKELSLALANAAELDSELPPSVRVEMEKKAQVNPSLARSTSEQMLDGVNPDAETINSQIDQARKSLLSLGLKTKIEVVQDGNSSYNPNLNLISISASQADGTTVAHEYFHAVLGQSVKTDAELQSMTRNMFDSVIRASEEGSSLNEKLKDFVSQYDSNIQNEEFLAQTVGELARQYQTLDLNTRTRIKVWINQVMQKLGVSGVFKEAQTDAEVIEQLNAFARFSGSAEGMTPNISQSQADSLSNGEITDMGEPMRGNRFQQLEYSQMPDNIFPDKPEKLSLITKEHSVDIQAIMDDVINNNKMVSFFAADQLGVGKTGRYNLDGGPSFAFTRDGVFWMSGSKDKLDNSSKMDQFAEDSDYIFVFAGSPTMHTYNKSVYNGFVAGIKKKYKTYEKFREEFKKVAKVSPKRAEELAKVLKDLDKFKSFDQLRDEGSGTPPPRKGLLNYVHAVSNASKDSKMKEFTSGLGLDLDSLRDGFYKKNDYGWLDLMVIGKPEGKTQKGDFHTTYADQFMGETLGVPNKRVNLRDLLSPEKYTEFVEKFVSEKKNARLKRWEEITSPEEVQERFEKETAKAAEMKSLRDKPEKQAARVERLEKKYLDEARHTDERVVQDYLDADKPSSSAGEKLNYSAGGMKTYYPSELRPLRSPPVRGTREQMGRRTARETEIVQGLSDDGMAILDRRGMLDSYRRIRSVLNDISAEYTALGLDKNFIHNYFPRLVADIDGYRKFFGKETMAVDAEIARYERSTGQKLSDTERQMMYEKLARSKLYRSGVGTPDNLKERKIRVIDEDQLGFYASPEKALDNYIEKMVNTIETKKLIGDGASGKTQGVEPVSGELGKIMDAMSKRGQLRSDQVRLIQDAVDARFGQHGSQSKIIKDIKNAGYLATMGNIGSTLTQLGDFYFTFVQNGFIPSMGALFGKPKIKMDDLGLAKDKVSIETADADRFSARAVDTIFKLTGLTAMDKLAKTTNINAAFSSLTKGAKANPNSKKYKRTLTRLKRTQGNDAYKTIADLQNGEKSDYVLEALYNELADVAPISLTEMPEGYAANPNGRILYSLKSYTIKQFNFLREKSLILLKQGVMEGDINKIAEGSSNTMKILIFSAIANGSADVLKAIIFGREIDSEDMFWNNILRMFGITKYTAVMARKEGFGEALTKTIAPPQLGILNDASKDIMNFENVSDLNTMKNIPLVGKIYYWREGRGVESEERLRRLKETPLRLGSPRAEDEDYLQAPEIRSPRSMGF